MPIARITEFGQENKAVKVACGDNFTVVLSQTGQLYSFGKGSHGRLGLGAAKMMTAGDGQSQQSLVELDDSTLVASQEEPVQI